MSTLRPDYTIETIHEHQQGTLPDLLGVRIVALGQGTLTGKLAVRPQLLAPNG